jgi:dTDP-4-dehydrorhamnose reductase
MKILITGASSYVGARLYLDLKKDFETVGTYHKNKLSKEFIELDITDEDKTIQTVKQLRPDVIVHAAANPSAKWCEENPELAVKINEKGTKYIVDAANSIGAKVIYISSKAAMGQTNIYGRTKLAGEEFVKNTTKGFIILRPSLVIGFSPNTTNDRPFNRMLKNLDEKTPAIYDNSWKFQPSWLGHISEVIKTVIERGLTNEIITVTVPETKSRFDVANDILSFFGITVIPKNENDKTPVTAVDLNKLRELKLPEYSYSEIISEIIEEIKHRDKYILD